MTLAEIRDAVDAKLATLWPTVQARQATYAANHNGRYFQLLPTHLILPADGLETALANLLAKPSYQAESGADFGGWPATLPMCLTIHQYDGPQGRGYAGICEVVVSGTTYWRAAQVGPETWRAFGWSVKG